MARMHSPGRGKSGSTKPLVDKAPEWSNADAKAVETYKTRELKNGRLAMIGIAGFVAADVIPGSVPSLA